MLSRIGISRFLSSSKRSLRLRAIAWFFVPTVVILIGIGLVNFYSYQDVTEDLVLERGQNLPRLSASRLATDLEDLTDFVSDVARDAAVIDPDSDTAHQNVLDRAGGQSPIFDGGVLILDTFGKVVATGPDHPERLGLDWSDRSYFRQIVRNQSLGNISLDPVFTNIIDDGSRETGAIAVAVPIVTDFSEFLGSVVGIFSLLSVNDFYSRIVNLRIGGSGDTYLVDGNGRVIYHSDTRHIAADFSAQPAVAQILERQAGNIRTLDIDGEDIVASFAPVPGTPWGLVTEESWSSLIGASEGYQRFLLLLLVLGVAVPIFFVVIGVKQIMRPLKDLATAARRMAKGDFDEPIAVQSGDEIMRLAEEFNVMAGALNESHQAMEERLADARLYYSMTSLSASDSSADAILEQCLDMVCEYVGWPVGHLYVQASDGTGELEPTTIWHLDDPDKFTDFRAVTLRTRFAPGVGLPGRVLSSGEPLWIPDVQLDDNFPRNQIGEDIGVRGAFGIPIKIGSETVAVLEFFSETVEDPNQHVLDVMAMVGSQFGRVLDRRRLDEALREANEELESRVADRTVELSGANESLEESNNRLEETLVELRNTQEHVAQQERLSALGTMASGIAHDFNNALSPILGYSGFLLEDADQFDETTVKYLRVISTSAEDAAAVVGRLKDFYRQREGSELMMPVDINDVVARVISLTQPRWRDMAQAKGIDIQLTTQLADNLPEVSGDEAELRTALGNVVFNAVDAMPDGGTITLRTYQDGEEIVLEVTDTGTGMSDDVLRRAMEPFFSTKDDQGTGMGLAMVYGTLQRHNGKLEVQSEVGQGTSVGFRLPIQTEYREIPTTLVAEPLPAGLRFLVVDDEQRVRDMVGDFLRREGSTVETATNGRDALEKFHRDKFDLVITDRGMPEMNGDALAAAIKEAAPNTPIIMLTGFGEMMISAGEKPAGVDRILGKPVTPAALRQAVTALRTEYAAAD